MESIKRGNIYRTFHPEALGSQGAAHTRAARARALPADAGARAARRRPRGEERDLQAAFARSPPPRTIWCRRRRCGRSCSVTCRRAWWLVRSHRRLLGEARDATVFATRGPSAYEPVASPAGAESTGRRDNAAARRSAASCTRSSWRGAAREGPLQMRFFASRSSTSARAPASAGSARARAARCEAAPWDPRASG